METNKQGDRVELIECTDPYTAIPPGTKGTVDSVDGIGTVHITWDNGRSLGLVPGEDKWKTLVNQSGPGVAIISSSELGTNCWLAMRFVKRGSRCARVMRCTYPEKKTCEAVKTELDYLRVHSQQLIDAIKKGAKESIQQLEKDLKK